jgi:hypothetical protein
MALAVTAVNASAFGAPSVPTFVEDLSISLDASYPSNGTTTFGYANLAAALQVALQPSPAAYPYPGQQPRTIVDILGCADLSGYVPIWDAAHQTLRIFQSAGSAAPLAEVTNGTDLHLTTLRLRVLSQ